MVLIRVLDRNGIEHEVEATAGLKLMEILRELEYGVAAICGGMLSCGTCHVYIDAEWTQRLRAPMPDERELLNELTRAKSESRLSCQIEVDDAMDGLRVAIAPDE
jgi:ferredoxin, 2Fe-2S